MFLLPIANPCARQAAAETNTLKIGLITSVTGPLAPAMKSIADAAKPAQDLMNQRGGITIKGQKYLIEVDAEDDQVHHLPGALPPLTNSCRRVSNS